MNCVKKTKKGLWYGVLLSALLFVGCSEKDAPPVEKGKVIFASNYPLAYFAEKISLLVQVKESASKYYQVKRGVSKSKAVEVCFLNRDTLRQP